jgi:uncharacterized protein HemX
MQTDTIKESATPKSTSAQNISSDKEAQQATPTPKDLLNQLSGVLPEGKDGVKQLYQLLSHPLIVIAGLCLLAYWLFTQRQQENGNPEAANLKKQVKKIKKRYKRQKLNTIAAQSTATTSLSVIE